MSEHSKYRPTLILGASPRISVPMARSLQRYGIPVDIASFQPEDPDIRSRAICGFHRLPPCRLDQAAFTRALLDLVRERNFDTILPAGDLPLAALRDLYEELSPLAHVGCPRPHIVERVLNKSLTLEAAQKVGIRVPVTCTISADQLDSVAPLLRFPVVAKPEKKGAAAFKTFYFHSLEELSAALTTNAWGRVMLQEYCPGVGVGMNILIHRGECIARFQHRRLKEAPVTGGVAILAIAEEPDPELFASSMALLRTLEWDGVAMVEFRVDRETGKSALMEVNGRFWGSVSFPILAGVDFPLYYWQLLHGEHPSVPHLFAVGMRWRWSPGYVDRLQSFLFRNGGQPGPKPSLLRDLIRSPFDFSPRVKEAVWSWSDPRPFFEESARAVWSLAAALSRSALRRVAPGNLKTYATSYFRLSRQSRPAYVRLRIRNMLHLSGGLGRPTLANAQSFLFVCFGNIMRSPMAELMLKRALENRGVRTMSVQSAGLHARPGREAHEWAMTVSRELGIPLDLHRAQAVTPELVENSDAVFAMDFENLAELRMRFPRARHKMFLLSCYATGRHKNREIADPYLGNIQTTRECYAVLQECIHGLAGDLCSARQTLSTQFRAAVGDSK
jgi:protein-tyrosine-phosphatase/predicted ATP-grasp superfamily ATP-dependent carboligase